MLIHTLKCEIAGIRELADVSEGNRETRKSRYTWIKVEGAEYELTKDEIMAWLENKERVTLPTRMNISTASIQ